MENKQQLAKLIGLIGRESRLKERIKCLRTQMGQMENSWLCSTSGRCTDGRLGITLRIRLATYLTLFPDVTPVEKTWEHSERGTMRYFYYPQQYVGCVGQTHGWVDAETESICVNPKTPQLTCTKEVAEAFGLDKFPDGLVKIEN